MDNTKYIGMDVHRETISIAVLDSAGKLVMESVIETKAITIVEYVRGLLMFPRLVRHKVWVYQSKCLGHMTIPTNGPVCLQHFRQSFGRNLVPLDSFSICTDQSRLLIVPFCLSEKLAAENTLPRFVPFGNNRQHQTVLWRGFNLP